MKRIVSAALLCLLTLALCVTAFAEEGQATGDEQTIRTEVREDGTRVTTVDNGDGHVFTVEELPEFGGDEAAPAPAPESAEEPGQKTQVTDGEESAAQEQKAAAANGAPSSGLQAWPFVVPAVLIVLGAAVAVLLRRRKKA